MAALARRDTEARPLTAADYTAVRRDDSLVARETLRGVTRDLFADESPRDSDEEPSPISEHDSSSRRCTWEKVADVLERPDSSGLAFAVHCFISAVILGSTLLTILETVPELRHYSPIFFVLDLSITVIFTVEFILRVWTAQSLVSFCLNGFNIVDFISVLPGYLELLMICFGHTGDVQMGTSFHKTMQAARPLRNIRLLRLVRVVRVARLFRGWKYAQIYLQEVGVLYNVMSTVSHTSIMLLMSALGLVTIMVASFLYVFESPQCLERQPIALSSELEVLRSNPAFQHVIDSPSGPYCSEKSQFDTIPAGFWWAITTLTTVGYGDMVPSTPMGKAVGCLTCVAAVMFVSTAAALMIVHFQARWLQEKAKASFRRRFASRPAMAREQDDLEGMLAELQDSADALLAKLAACAAAHASQHNNSSSAPPLLRSISVHANIFVNGTCAYIYDVLFEAMLLTAGGGDSGSEGGGKHD
eukprot:TRINITY_DN18925_c0_g1_i1.p1 TRINITY_DN18925_c0_g1~~TRINITY_DN18925_c0_g1_i1.p1  ORF type:complete len:473 (+),score=72.07 TRINITY_DN18925_c0_g1_i1:85-1503(+)